MKGASPGTSFPGSTMSTRLCAGIVLTLAAAAQEVAFFGEYAAGSEQPSVLASDSTKFYMTDGVFRSLSLGPGSSTPGFLRKTDSEDNEQWVRRFSSSTIVLRRYGLAVFEGATYVAGYAGGNFSASTRAIAFVRKYSAGGTELWVRQFSSDKETGAFGAAVDATGVYISGERERSTRPIRHWRRLARLSENIAIPANSCGPARLPPSAHTASRAQSPHLPDGTGAAHNVAGAPGMNLEERA